MGKHIHKPPKNFESWKAYAAAHNIKYNTFINRVHNNGWDRARAATEPVQLDPTYEIDGVGHTIAEWCRIYGVAEATVHKRLQRGAAILSALTEPKRVFRLTDEERAVARKARYARRRTEIFEKIRKYKNRPCLDCGEIFHPEIMEFDHVRGKKLFNLSRPPLNIKRVAAEIAKCDLVCANCHRLRTAKRRAKL
jgi:hypothetical protein